MPGEKAGAGLKPVCVKVRSCLGSAQDSGIPRTVFCAADDTALRAGTDGTQDVQAVFGGFCLVLRSEFVTCHAAVERARRGSQEMKL